MSNIFKDCKSLQNIAALRNWNVSKVESMTGMFCNCEDLKCYM